MPHRLVVATGLLLAPLWACAADPAPEIARTKPFDPQAQGTTHAVRIIPEACARLEGSFSGDAGAPYRLKALRSAPNCQPRARFVADANTASPSLQQGWILNDRIRIPNAACSGQVAVVSVWRKPVSAQPPKLDAQGRSRIYLEAARQQAGQHKLAQVPAYAAVVDMQGAACGQ